MRKSVWTWRHILVLCLHALPLTRALGAEDTIYQVAFEQLLQSGQLELNSDDAQVNQQHAHEPGESESDISGEGRSSPWLDGPICTTYIPRLQSELCVYTNTSFAGERGISLFTTPQIAKEFDSLHLRNNPAFRRDRDAETNVFSETWYTKDSPSKGVGMFARQDLNRSDPITSSTPVLLAYKEAVLPKPEREEFLRHAIGRLPPATGNAYRFLATMYHDPAFLMQDIASANSFEMDIAGTPHLAVMPAPSRINHDCAPNSIFVSNSTALTHTVRAARAIAKDEEITIAYTNPLEPFAQRQKYLHDSFGFECSCARCQRGETGDAVLDEMVTLQRSLSKWADPTSTSSTKQAERLIRIHQQEGLMGYVDPAYCLAALMYNSVGSERGAKKYVKLCIEGIELRLGKGAADLPQWRKMLDSPRGHWSWMRRKQG
ncbi:hypothetical protein H2200_006769 [Cladophialophora chaetospira]|uniref:SET domain-containing protein n=1 Tax=Cladophialophora chaetospira TaxID=386627 RepID=A0AA39CI17_9EURO|nr:hypothetical protein H2200_006769 [Cladophialophora chaetospira]